MQVGRPRKGMGGSEAACLDEGRSLFEQSPGHTLRALHLLKTTEHRYHCSLLDYWPRTLAPWPHRFVRHHSSVSFLAYLGVTVSRIRPCLNPRWFSSICSLQRPQKILNWVNVWNVSNVSNVSISPLNLRTDICLDRASQNKWSAHNTMQIEKVETYEALYLSMSLSKFVILQKSHL